MKKITKSNRGGGLENKAFTLIELLAVIIILVVIALISVPIVLNIIEKARKSAFQDSAYGIMESAKLYYVENIIDNKELGDKVFSYEEELKELKYSGTRPKGGTVILKSNGKIELSIHNGKWCAIKGEEEQNVRVIDYDEKTCKIETPMMTEGSSVENIEAGLDSPIPGSYYNIENQKGTITCINLSDENKEVKNTSELGVGENCIKCRMIYENREITSLSRTFQIIKVEKTADQIMNEDSGENGAVVTDPGRNKRFAGSDPNNYVEFNGELFRIIGVFNGQMKIMQNDFYSTGKAWDINGSYGSYNWTRPAILNTELNSTYWNSISTEYQNMVDQNHVWKIGGSTRAPRIDYYNAENNLTWLGKVGLMSVVDDSYASSNPGCTDSTYLSSGGSICLSDNWISSEGTQWTITGCSSYGSDAVYATNFNIYGSKNLLAVRPVLFLKSDIKIIGGKGTSNNPYKLSF